MIEELCNIWDKYDAGETVCITINGYVKRDGRAVMGRGTAKQALEHIPWLDQDIGTFITDCGLGVAQILSRIVIFPVKPVAGQCKPDRSNIVPHMRGRFKPYDLVPGWAMMADLGIIERSMIQLQQIYSFGLFSKIYLPRPGCGAGGLVWGDVEETIEMYSGGGDPWLVVCSLPEFEI